MKNEAKDNKNLEAILFQKEFSWEKCHAAPA